MLFVTADGKKANVLILKVQNGEYVEKSMEIAADTSNVDGIAALLLTIHFLATAEKAYIDLGLIQCFTDINVFGNYNAMRDVLQNTGEIIDCGNI